MNYSTSIIAYNGKEFHSFTNSTGIDDSGLLMQTNGVELYFCQRIIRTHRYKLVFNGYDVEELYDLEDDPHEVINLAENP